MARKVVGFILGFGLTFLAVFLFFSLIGMRPRGAGWLFLMIGAGSVGARWLSKNAPLSRGRTYIAPELRSKPGDKFPPLFGEPK